MVLGCSCTGKRFFVIDNKKIVLKVIQYLDEAIKSVMQICYKKGEIEMMTWDQYKSLFKNQFKHPTNRCYDPWDGSHSFISNQAAGQARGHHGKSSDQTDKELCDCQDKHGWLDAACMKY